MRTRFFNLSVLLLGLFAGCGVGSMDYIPDKEVIENKFQEFLAGAIEIKGIYGNYDVDSMIFKYNSKDNNLLKTIEKKAAKKGWIVLESNGDRIILYRKYPPRGKDGSGPYSYELAKIHYIEQSRNVCVGWLQIDENYDVIDPDKTGEGKWAKRNLWPNFEQCCNGSN